eukprot:c3226_g1_i1 orf=2-166(-)
MLTMKDLIKNLVKTTKPHEQRSQGDVAMHILEAVQILMNTLHLEIHSPCQQKYAS